MKFEIYPTNTDLTKNKKTWNWRLRSRNGRIIANGGQPFNSKRGVRKAIHTIVYPIYRSGAYSEEMPQIKEVVS
jgi:uncharacterized protein YegP (UPF0339 family)